MVKFAEAGDDIQISVLGNTPIAQATPSIHGGDSTILRGRIVHI